MKKIWAIAICVVLWGAGIAQTVDFRTYGGDGADHAYDLVEVVDGYFLVGSTASPNNGNTDIYLLKLNDDLTVDWSKTYGGLGVDQPRAIHQLPNGDLIILAFTTTGDYGAYDIVLYRIDSISGEEVWNQSYGTADWDLSVDMELVGDAIYLLTKSYGIPGSNGHILLLEIDQDGIQTNEWTISGEGSWDPVDLLASGDSLFMAYTFIPEEGNSSFFVVKYDDTLTPIWTLEKAGTEGAAYMAGGLDLNQYGLAMAGSFRDQTISEQFQHIFYNIDPYTGELEVEATEPISGEQFGKAVAWYNDIALLVGETDETFGAGGQGVLVEVRYFEGNWFNGTVFGGEEDEVPEGILKDGQGRVLIWGSTYSYGNGTEEMMLIRLPNNTVNNQLDVEVTTFQDEFVTDVNTLDLPTFNVEQSQGVIWATGLAEPTMLCVLDLQGRTLWSGLSTQTISTQGWSSQFVLIRPLNGTYASRMVLIQH